MRLNARQLRDVKEDEAQSKLKHIKRHPIYFILENIYDTYNVGGLFRLADAIAAKKIYLCGETEIPPNPKIKKASIGTYKVVPWEYKRSSKEAIEELRSRKSKVESQKSISQFNNQKKTTHYSLLTTNSAQIIAVEQSPKSVPYAEVNYRFPLALIFGNESYGVLPETLELANQIVEIPMWGINKSLNVIVSAAIVSYFTLL